MNTKYFLTDGIVGLRAVVTEDVSGEYLDWLNDYETCRGNTHFRAPYSKQDLLKYVETTNSSPTEYLFAVCKADTGRHIGNIALQNHSIIDRSCNISFLLGVIGERGNSVMYRAGTLLIKHGFIRLNLNRIACGTLSNNIGMIKLAGKFGMVKEGVRRNAVYKEDGYVDIVEFGLLKSEWKSLNCG